MWTSMPPFSATSFAQEWRDMMHKRRRSSALLFFGVVTDSLHELLDTDSDSTSDSDSSDGDNDGSSDVGSTRALDTDSVVMPSPVTVSSALSPFTASASASARGHVRAASAGVGAGVGAGVAAGSSRARRGSVYKPKLRSRRATLRKSIRVNRRRAMRQSLIRGDSGLSRGRKVQPRIYVPMFAQFRSSWRMLRHVPDGASVRLYGVDGEILGLLNVESGVWDAAFDATIHKIGRMLCCGSFSTWRRFHPRLSIHETLNLPYPHKLRGEVCTGAHVRRCIIDTGQAKKVMANASLVFPGTTVAIYWLGLFFKALWQLFVYFVTFTFVRKGCGKSRSRSSGVALNEHEVEHMLTASLMRRTGTEGGSSIRFDELIREVRVTLLRKHPNKYHAQELEKAVISEATAIMDSFSECLLSVGSREKSGYDYVPAPVDTSRATLPSDILRVGEIVAENTHEVWSKERIDQGWRWGAKRDNAKKLHPDLIPYSMLTEETKQYDRDTAFETLKVVVALNYKLVRRRGTTDAQGQHATPRASVLVRPKFGKPAPPGQTYVPKPMDTSHVELPPHIVPLAEMLAENTHEVWAKSRLKQGWKYGPQRDDTAKTHNGLVPYLFLSEAEKQFDRNTATQAVKLLLALGYDIVPGRHRSLGATLTQMQNVGAGSTSSSVTGAASSQPTASDV